MDVNVFAENTKAVLLKKDMTAESAHLARILLHVVGIGTQLVEGIHRSCRLRSPLRSPGVVFARNLYICLPLCRPAARPLIPTCPHYRRPAVSPLPYDAFLNATCVHERKQSTNVFVHMPIRGCKRPIDFNSNISNHGCVMLLAQTDTVVWWQYSGWDEKTNSKHVEVGITCSFLSKLYVITASSFRNERPSAFCLLGVRLPVHRFDVVACDSRSDFISSSPGADAGLSPLESRKTGESIPISLYQACFAGFNAEQVVSANLELVIATCFQVTVFACHLNQPFNLESETVECSPVIQSVLGVI